MPFEQNTSETVHKLCERLYAGDVLSDDEASLLLIEVRRLSVNHEVSFALGALDQSGIPGSEDVIASFLYQSHSPKLAVYALRSLCFMGLCQKYRHDILKALRRPPFDKAYPHAATTAIGCMGKCLKKHKDREFAELLSGFLLAEKHLPSAASDEFILARAARLAAANAIGANLNKVVDDETYSDECVARFLAERKFG